MHEHYVASQRLVADLNAFQTKGLSSEALQSAQAEFSARIRAVRDEAVSLRDTFQELWLRTNQPANLHYAIDEYNAIIKVWDDAAARAAAGAIRLRSAPAGPVDLSSGRRGRPRGAARVLSQNAQADPRDVESAGIQVHGDTHVKIYVNGAELGEQFARRNLSAPVNPKLLVVYDIKPHLRDGENVIAVDARDYGTLNAELEPGGPARSGGFHLYGEIRDTHGKVRPILSDETWKASASEKAGWNKPGFDDRDWPSAKSDPLPTVWVTYPDIAKGLRGYSDVR